MEELRGDILKAASYIPGKHRLNLHEIYGDLAVPLLTVTKWK